MKAAISFIDLSTATTQEVFDWSCMWILTQGQPSIDFSSNGCLYQSDNGNRCAGGSLLSKSVMKKVLDAGKNNEAWSGLTEKNLVSRNHLSLVEALQDAHDCAGSESLFLAPEKQTLEFIKLFCRNARKVAEKFGVDDIVLSLSENKSALKAFHSIGAQHVEAITQEASNKRSTSRAFDQEGEEA
jgi:hypothetical protein